MGRNWQGRAGLRESRVQVTCATIGGHDALSGGSLSVGAGVGNGAGPGGPSHGGGGAGAVAERGAAWAKLVDGESDASGREPFAGPRAPALQARGARLDPALAHARLAYPTAGPGGAGARGAGGRRGAGDLGYPRAGVRALRALGDLHGGPGLAGAGADGGLGGAPVSLAQAAVHAHGLRPAVPNRCRLAGRAAAPSGGRSRLPQPAALPDAAGAVLGLDHPAAHPRSRPDRRRAAAGAGVAGSGPARALPQLRSSGVRQRQAGGDGDAGGGTGVGGVPAPSGGAGQPAPPGQAAAGARRGSAHQASGADRRERRDRRLAGALHHPAHLAGGGGGALWALIASAGRPRAATATPRAGGTASTAGGWSGWWPGSPSRAASSASWACGP